MSFPDSLAIWLFPPVMPVSAEISLPFLVKEPKRSTCSTYKFNLFQSLEHKYIHCTPDSKAVCSVSHWRKQTQEAGSASACIGIHEQTKKAELTLACGLWALYQMWLRNFDSKIDDSVNRISKRGLTKCSRQAGELQKGDILCLRDE